MRSRDSLLCTALALTAFLGATASGHSAQSVRQSLIGAWELVSTQERLSDGTKRPYPDVGPQGKGYLIYTADGHMCATGMNPDLPRWADIDKPTDAEKVAAFDGFFGYCGRYEVDSANHTIYHYPEVSLNPAFLGTKQKRPYTIDGDLLTFSDKDTAPGVVSYSISWRKVK